MRSKLIGMVGTLCVFASSALAIPPRENASPNMKAVQAERDRGAGRIIDQQSYELDRMQDDRRQFDQLLDERDRQLRIDQQSRQQRDAQEYPTYRAPAPLAAPAAEPAIISDIFASDMQLFVMRTERELTALKQETQRKLAAAEAERARALQDADATPSPDIRQQRRAQAETRFNENRERILQEDRDRRRQLLGWPTSQPAMETGVRNGKPE